MTANELRIGNWVNDLCGNGIMQVDALVLSDIGMFDLQGIPLTPEVLIQYGFVTGHSDYYFKNGIEVNIKDEELNGIGSIPLQYLHQLQNLYFALTGTELEYNPIKEKPYLEVICKEEHSVEWPDEDQEIVDDYVSGVREWDKKGETTTYIFYCDPCFVPKVVEALQSYKVELSYVTYMFYTQAQISVQRKIDSDFTEIGITNYFVFGRLNNK